jgi:hypothetical protein
MWFAAQFVLGIGAVVVMAGIALAIALQSLRAVTTLAVVGSLAASAAAGGVLIITDLLGMRVGTGHANMAKVTVLGFVAASLVGGMVFGRVLARHAASAAHNARSRLMRGEHDKAVTDT